MDGITIADLRARHAECVEARVTMRRDFELKDSGFAYVLGELEQLIALVEERQSVAPLEEES